MEKIKVAGADVLAVVIIALLRVVWALEAAAKSVATAVGFVVGSTIFILRSIPPQLIDEDEDPTPPRKLVQL